MNQEIPYSGLFKDFTPEPVKLPLPRLNGHIPPTIEEKAAAPMHVDEPAAPAELVSANQFTVEELTDAYNETRLDYMVPMPMNAARLQEYINLYQIDLSNSLVVIDEGKKVGLGMLGVRPGRSWITRLGLVASTRGKGIGSLLMNGLVGNSEKLGLEKTILEVIKGNEPAHKMFKKFGFEEQRELLILRRAPAEVPKPTSEVSWLELDECLHLLKSRQGMIAWTNQTESLEHAKGVTGLKVTTQDGKTGWLVFQRTLFNLSRLMFDTQDKSADTMRELLYHLHSHYPTVDTYTENIPADDPHLQAMLDVGYLEAFSRIEMHRPYKG